MFALALSISFVLASPINSGANFLFTRMYDFLARFETDSRLPEDETVVVSGVEGVVFGLGRVGAAAYENLQTRYGKKILGVDFDIETMNRYQEKGWNVLQGDVTDPDFWQRMLVEKNQVKMAILAMPNFHANLYAAARVREMGFAGTLAAIVRFDDQIEELLEAGVDVVYNLHREAGSAFADHVCARMGQVVK